MTEAPRTLLVVDDEPYILPALAALLANSFEVLTADSADAAEEHFRRRPIHIVLTDQKMPRRTGTQLLEWVRLHSPRTIRLLMTGFAELEDAVEAINRGHVYHYFLKPWRTEDLLQVLRNAAEKFDLEQSRDGLLQELQALNHDLEQRVAERTRELEEANQLLQHRARELERLALTDPLTGLFNRRAIDELARFEMKRHARYPSAVAVGILDADHFRHVNSRYLLTGGDAVLKDLARVLSGSIREVDSVGRVGGEEFVVIARETNLEGAARLAERIRANVENTAVEFQGHQIQITVSLGFAVADANVATDYDAMYQVAAEALREAKDQGRNRAVVKPITGTESAVRVI